MNTKTKVILDAQHTAIADIVWPDWFDDDLMGALPVDDWKLLTGYDALDFISHVHDIHMFMRVRKITDAARGYSDWVDNEFNQ